jgi:hypothetical protein
MTGTFLWLRTEKLIKLLIETIFAGKVLYFLKIWLEAPVAEKKKKTCRVKRTTYNKDKRIDTRLGVPDNSLIFEHFLAKVYI